MTNEEIMAIGHLSGLMEAVQKTQDQQNETMVRIFDRLDKLPCKDHTSVLKQILTWKDTCEGTETGKKQDERKGFISFKWALVLLFCSTALSIGSTLLTVYLTAPH